MMNRLFRYWQHLGLLQRLMWLIVVTNLSVLLYAVVPLPPLGLLPLLLFVWWVSHVLLSRSLGALGRLVTAVDAMKQGDYEVQVDVQGAPELRMLGVAFNDGIARAKRLIVELRSREAQQSELLERITAQNFAFREERRSINAAVIVAETDVQGNITYVNDKFCQITGYVRGELLGKNHSMLGTGGLGQTGYRALWATINAGNVWTGEFHNRTKRGDGYWVQTTIVPILDDATRKPRHFKAISIDITPRKQLEELLHQERERAEITLASIGDAVISTDVQGNITFLNEVAETLTGCRLAEAKGLAVAQVFDLLHEVTHAPVGNPVMQALAEKRNVKIVDHAVLRARNGQECGIECTAAPIVMSNGQLIGAVLVFHDVSEKRRLMSAVQWQAGHDALTRLPNRNLLNDSILRALAEARRNETLTAVCLLDLDDFKPVNDTYGHETGDNILIELAERLVVTLRHQDMVARLGGDEFVLLLNGFRQVDEIEPLLNRLLEVIAEPFLFGNTAVHVCGSIGITFYPLDDADPDTLLRHADQAMYQAKQSGRNRFHLFDLLGDQQVQSSFRQIERLRQALYNDEFLLYYQPKVNMRTGRVIGMEALLRWLHPERGLVPPQDFLPAIEQNGLIVEVGEWVIEQALRQIEYWLEAGYVWHVSVNIAGLHFQQADFCERLALLLSRHPLVPPQLLQIEILESAALGELDHARGTVASCQALGVSFALDDFGTGYSSLNYLKHLDVDALKIDQGFVRDMLVDRAGLSLVEAVVSMASVFATQVVAEGVETTEHGVLLIRLGCDLGQGYGIARPMPPEQVAPWSEQYVPDPSWAMWANTHWELSDFPLLVAQYDHLKWIKAVVAVVYDAPLAICQSELHDHHQCRFGNWYYGPGRKRYGHLPEFAVLETTHMEVHRMGMELVRLYHAGEIERARALSEELMRLKDRVLQLLTDLQHAVMSEVVH